MVELTDRQIQLLKCIVEEYIDSAEPVGSQVLEKKYNLGVSPATIRNEMARLTDNGFLKQPHTSAGRVPTPMALKFYIQNLMEPKELSVTDEVRVKEKIWDYRQEVSKLLREAVKALADKTHTLAMATTEEGDIYYAGTANLLDMLEFYDMIATKNLLMMLDRHDYWWKLFSRSAYQAPYYVLFGEDIESRRLDNCGFVYARVKTPALKCTIGIVGPARLNYPYVIPVVRYFGDLLEDIGQNW